MADGQERDVVERIARVFVVVLTRWRFRDGGEHLDRNIAFGQTWQVNLAIAPTFGQVAVPQQAIGVPIPDDEVSVQCGTCVRHRVGGVCDHVVAGLFDIGRRKGEKSDRTNDDQNQHDGHETFDEPQHKKTLPQVVEEGALDNPVAQAKPWGNC